MLKELLHTRLGPASVTLGCDWGMWLLGVTARQRVWQGPVFPPRLKTDAGAVTWVVTLYLLCFCIQVRYLQRQAIAGGAAHEGC